MPGFTRQDIEHGFLPKSTLRNAGAPETLPKVVGHSHALQQETVLAKQKAVGNVRMTFEGAQAATLPQNKPLTETIEALVKLETRITMQQAQLESALVGSFNEVVTVCTHLVRQCDAITAQMHRLEVFAIDHSRLVSLSSQVCDETDLKSGTGGKCTIYEDEIIDEFRETAPRSMDQGTQTQDGKYVEGTGHAVSISSERTNTLDSDLRLSFDTCAMSPPGSPPGSPGRTALRKQVRDGREGEHHPRDRPSGCLSVRPSDNSAGSKFRRNNRSVATFETMIPAYPSEGFFGRPYVMKKHKGSPKRTSGRSVNAIFSKFSGRGRNHSEGRSNVKPVDGRGSKALEINLSEEGTAANLMFGAVTTDPNHESNVVFDGQPTYALPQFYVPDHWATRLTLHPQFLKFRLWVVFFNSVYIGIEAQENHAKSLYRSPLVYIIMSNLFCTFYVLEWMLHVMSFKHPRYAVKRGRNLLDTVLAFVTALDVWVIEPVLFYNDATITQYFGPAQIVRIAFLARLARFVRAVPELLTLARGVVMATKAVFWTGVMVAILTYMFGIVMFTILEGEESVNQQLGDRNFESLENSMWTLLMDGALIEEFGAKMTVLRNTSRVKTSLACLVMSCYMFIAFLTILNMLIGVMNEVVNSITALEKTEAAISLMRQTILKQLLKFDDGNGLISQYELERVLTDKESEEVLRSLNVDRLFLLELQQMLFPNDDSQVTVSTVVELMLLCRGDSQTTVRTLASGLLYISSLIYNLEAGMKAAGLSTGRDISPKIVAHDVADGKPPKHPRIQRQGLTSPSRSHYPVDFED